MGLYLVCCSVAESGVGVEGFEGFYVESESDLESKKGVNRSRESESKENKSRESESELESN